MAELTEAQKRNAEKNRKYWADREKEQLKHNITEEAEYDKEIKRIHQNMLDACQKEIESFYAKYAKAEGISLADAKKRVSKLDIAAYERKAAKYVKEKDFSPKANEEMRIYNATMKINRLEMLKANIGLELIAGHDELEKFMGGILKGRTMDELKRQAGILGKTVKNNAAKADAIVNGSFHSGTFSDRIWQYQDLMREDLAKLLQQGLIQGKGARAITKDLRKYLVGDKTGKGATYNVERLMRTELARVQTEAQKQSFIRNGFEYYEFICNFHASKSGTCPICQGLNGKHFKVAKMMPGENAPPMHPHCRCSTAAWEDDAEYEAWLDYLEKGGTTKAWNAMDAAVRNQLIAAKRVEMKTAETERQYGVKYSDPNVDFDYINSEDYKKKFTALTHSPEVNEAIYETAKRMLKHCDGTKHEDLYLINADDGTVFAKETETKRESGVVYSEQFLEKLEELKASGIRVIGIHNHPQGTPPTADDFRKAQENGYMYGIVAGHNGQVYVFETPSEPISKILAESMENDICGMAVGGTDIDRASKMVYDIYGLKYTIIDGGAS